MKIEVKHLGLAGMRDVRFRALDVMERKWIYGHYVVLGMFSHLIDCVWEKDKTHATPIVSYTLGQYTGITDVNDTEIYEGDIVTADSEYDGIITNVVSWYRGGFTVGGHTFRELYNIEVVGNIHDKNYLSKGVNKNEDD